MYQSGSLQYRQLGTSQLKKQGARLHPSGTHTPQRTVVECSIAEVHRDITEKYKEATGQGLQKKATPIREGNSNQRGNHNPAASRLGRKTGRTLWSARLPNLHP